MHAACCCCGDSNRAHAVLKPRGRSKKIAGLGETVRSDWPELREHEAPPCEDLKHVPAARCIGCSAVARGAICGRCGGRADGKSNVAWNDEDLAHRHVQSAELRRDMQHAQLWHD